MTIDPAPEAVRDFRETWIRLRKEGEYRHCVYEDHCTERAIYAHSVSRSVLNLIQADGHVIRPGTDFDGENLTRPYVNFEAAGLRSASTGTFICHKHDSVFQEIDASPVDIENPHIRNLFLYRAVLREIWRLLSVRPMTDWVDYQGPGLQRPTIHPESRLQSLLYWRNAIKPFITSGGPIRTAPPVEHLVRRVKSAYPVLAASGASGGLSFIQDQRTGTKFLNDRLRSHLGVEKYACWSMTIVPQEKEHVVLVSWLKGSAAQRYFTHLIELQGRELEAAISAQLILFHENWFISPLAWKGYGKRKQEAVLNAYYNFDKMLTGGYSYLDTDQKIPWYEHLDLPNRHQINLFAYDQFFLKVNRP